MTLLCSLTGPDADIQAKARGCMWNPTRDPQNLDPPEWEIGVGICGGTSWISLSLLGLSSQWLARIFARTKVRSSWIYSRILAVRIFDEITPATQTVPRERVPVKVEWMLIVVGSKWI